MEDSDKEPITRLEDDQGWRWYEHKGKKYLSATLVLGCVQPQRLVNYYKNNTKAAINKRLKETGDIGTRIHSLIEADCKGQDVALPDDLKTPFENWCKVRVKHKIEPYKSEVMVVSERLGVAGTMDILGHYEGTMSVMDIKTGFYSVKAGWQMAFYKNAYEEMTQTKNLGMVGIQIPRDGSEPKTFKYEHFDWCFECFLAALQAFKGLNYTKLAKAEWPWLHSKGE